MKKETLIKQLCNKRKISLAELARMIGQSPQNFNKKLKRDTLSTEELINIGVALNAEFEQFFILESGEKIDLLNKDNNI